MNSVDAWFLLGATVWWSHLLYKLWEHAHDPEFLQMPWLHLWTSTYSFGWVLFLSNDAIRFQLYAILAQTPLGAVGDTLQITIWLIFQCAAYP